MAKYDGELRDTLLSVQDFHGVIKRAVDELFESGGVVFTADPEKVLATFAKITRTFLAPAREKMVDAVDQQVDLTTQVYEHWGKNAYAILKSSLHESISEAFRYAAPGYLSETQEEIDSVRRYTPSADELKADTEALRRAYRTTLKTRGRGRYQKQVSNEARAAKRQELENKIADALRRYGPDAKEWRIADAIFYQGKKKPQQVDYRAKRLRRALEECGLDLTEIRDRTRNSG
jgi:hypothetical protein